MLMSRTAGHQLASRCSFSGIWESVLNRHQCGLFPNVVQDWNNWLLKMIHRCQRGCIFLAFGDLLWKHVCIRFRTDLRNMLSFLINWIFSFVVRMSLRRWAYWRESAGGGSQANLGKNMQVSIAPNCSNMQEPDSATVDKLCHLEKVEWWRKIELLLKYTNSKPHQ